MSKKKNKYYIVVPDTEKRKKPVKFWGAFEFSDQGKARAEQYAKDNSNHCVTLIVREN